MLVTTTIEGSVAVIRLTDGEHRNALSPTMSLALEVAVENAVAQGSRALVLCAEPPVFCAGGSLDSLLARTAPLGDTYRGFQALLHAPVPTVAAVDGPAIGAGVNLSLCCDVVLVSRAARFDPRFLDLCIHPGGGAVWHLQRRVGRQGAAAMVLMGDVLEGEEAVTHGLAWRCVESADLDGAALSLARRVAERDPELVARTRDTLATSLLLGTADEAVEARAGGPGVVDGSTGVRRRCPPGPGRRRPPSAVFAPSLVRSLALRVERRGVAAGAHRAVVTPRYGSPVGSSQSNSFSAVWWVMRSISSLGTPAKTSAAAGCEAGQGPHRLEAALLDGANGLTASTGRPLSGRRSRGHGVRWRRRSGSPPVRVATQNP